MKIQIIEHFYSIQGEGQSCGRPAYFIRFPGCNLKCNFCDTKYASRVIRGKEIELQEIISEILEKPVKIIVFTGGEPLLRKKEIRIITEFLPKHEIEIETNGTIDPIEWLPFNQEVLIRYNVSPKLSSSGNRREDAIRLDTLKKFLDYNSIFKFVIKTRQDWEEMEYIIRRLKIPASRVWIMPCAVTHKEWVRGAKRLFEHIKDSGYNLSPRLHISLFGKKKGI